MTENEKLDLILADMQSMKHDMEGMKHDMEGVKQDIADMKQDINDVNQRVTKLDMILDNEIRVNIQRVAEGHLDLSRNLHAGHQGQDAGKRREGFEGKICIV